MKVQPSFVVVISSLALGFSSTSFANGSLSPWWQPNVITGLPPAIYPSLFVSGFYAPGFGSIYGFPTYLYRPSYLCRSSGYSSHWQYGHVYNGTCYVGFNGIEENTHSFSYLAGGSHLYWGRSWSMFASSGTRRFEQVCRAEVGGSVVTGTLEDQNCVVAFEGAQVISPEFEVLLEDRGE
jgi:hypothetical protein